MVPCCSLSGLRCIILSVFITAGTQSLLGTSCTGIFFRLSRKRLKALIEGSRNGTVVGFMYTIVREVTDFAFGQ